MLNSYTMEASYGGTNMGSRAFTHFTTDDYEGMGRYVLCVYGILTLKSYRLQDWTTPNNIDLLNILDTFVKLFKITTILAP